MVNFHDPAVIEQDSVVLTKLSHAVGGLYIWEYFTTLEYEWSVIRGHRPYRWTIWIYSLARLSALLVVSFGFLLMGNVHINCQVAIFFETAFAFLTMSASSLLIGLRAVAIWNRNKLAVVTTIVLWGINTAFFIQLVAHLHTPSAPIHMTCTPDHIKNSALKIVTTSVTDTALLLIMLVGLFRLRSRGGGVFRLAQLLWRQGVIWLLLAMAAEIPPVVFILLDLNVPFDDMFRLPAYITMTIAATRMYRSLSDFTSITSKPNDRARKNLQNSNPVFRVTKRMNTTSIPVDRMEVTVHIVSEQHETPQMMDDSSRIRVGEKVHRESNELNCDVDVERGL